ncbi:glycosyltransferase family 87 protein [Cupriavidus sp. Agwp_2]|uniref:glycosyltransferase family 87 protein n=1 Tax=Cupriavidus sp. Agwp_2 TaxID=2897324 RepID=UPI003460D99B
MKSRHWLSLARIKTYSVAMLVIYVSVVMIWGLKTKGFTSDSIVRPGVDFSAFWAASYLALKGQAASVYDYDALKPVIAAFGAVPGGGKFFLPWAYPPTFLLFVVPLSLLPFAASYTVFICGTAAIYVSSLIRLMRFSGVPRHAVWLPVLAFPGVPGAVLIGQNSLLTAGIAAWSVILLKRRPVVAGALIGLLSVKPQFGLLLPVVLVADRAWKTFFTAGVTAITLGACSIALWGWETVPTFLGNGTHFKETVLEQGGVGWRFSPTIFAMLRQAGGSVAAAYWIHGLCAAFAIWALIRVWRSSASTGLRIAALAASTLLFSPYLWYYELTWLGVAIAGLAVEGVRRGWMARERELLVLAWLLPLPLALNGHGYFPPIGPLVTLLLLLAVLRRAVTDGREN